MWEFCLTCRLRRQYTVCGWLALRVCYLDNVETSEKKADFNKKVPYADADHLYMWDSYCTILFPFTQLGLSYALRFHLLRHCKNSVRCCCCCSSSSSSSSSSSLGIATIIILIISPLLCVICVFSCHQRLGFLLSKGGHGVLNVRNRLGVSCAHDDETGTQASTRKN